MQHILLIDDDKDELSIFLDALTEMKHEDGFKCTYSASTEQALKLLKFFVPAYIFVDLNIPRMDGLDFLSAIKNDPSLKHTKIYLYSTKISEATRQTAILLGASGCIGKTNTIHGLSVELKTILTMPSATSQFLSIGK
jgi:CheY-like chemotaxis protein